MTKTEAIALFGTRPIDLARAVGVSKQAINNWGDTLTRLQEAQVLAELWRRQNAPKPATDPAAEPAAEVRQAA
jgi:hypothetical protein